MKEKEYKILLVASDLKTTGGIQTYLNQFIQCLRENNFKITIIELNKRNISLKNSISLFYNLYKSDLVLIGHVNLLFLSLLNLNFSKFIVFVYGVELFKPRSKLAIVFFKKFYFRSIITCSNYTKQFCINNLKVKSKIDIIYPYSKFEKDNYKNTNNLIKSSKRVISSISRLDGFVTQGIWLTLQCIAKKKYKNIIFNIYGKGSESSNIQKFINDHELSNVKICGFVDDLTSIYQSSDFFLYLTDQTGLGCVVIDAIYFNKPIIISSSSASAEVFDNNYQFKTKDDKDSKGMLKILDFLEDKNSIPNLKLRKNYQIFYSKLQFKKKFLKIIINE